jgi:regulator of nucleoside diphosphate kinase
MTANIPERASLHLIDREADVIADLALQVEQRQPQLSALLLAEIDRAEIHAAGDLPPHTVAMNSYVTFIDEGSGNRREVQLVYPQNADIGEGRISILTPVGAGLVGLAKGQSILWPDRDGHTRRLRIEDVRPGNTA